MSNTILIIYVVVFVAIIWFMGPMQQRKEKKKKDAMMSSLAVGDYVMTTSGMYGQLIDITNDMVIIEFGGKNCRIPMLKAAIASVEKPDALAKGEVSEDAKADK